MLCDAFTTGYLRSSLLILKAQPCVLMELPSSTDLECLGMSLKLTGGIMVNSSMLRNGIPQDF